MQDLAQGNAFPLRDSKEQASLALRRVLIGAAIHSLDKLGAMKMSDQLVDRVGRKRGVAQRNDARTSAAKFSQNIRELPVGEKRALFHLHFDPQSFDDQRRRQTKHAQLSTDDIQETNFPGGSAQVQGAKSEPLRLQSRLNQKIRIDFSPPLREEIGK